MKAAPPPIRIGDRLVGPGEPTYVIAEAGVNHNADPEMARRMVDAAVEAGADAVKFQAFSAESLATKGAQKFRYARRSPAEDESLREMLKKLELPRDAFTELAAYCRDQGIPIIITPFDEGLAEFVADLGVPAMKVGSSDNDNPPVLRRVAATGLPVIYSTGMCSLEDVARGISILREAGALEIAVLQCTTSYPLPADQTNLRAIPVLREAFGLPVGFSDHTMGTHCPVAAVALGACIIEKHFTLDRSLPGPDQEASLEPDELGEMVRQIREVETALGDGVKRVLEAEAGMIAEARRFVVAARELSAGHVLRRRDIALKRSGGGIPARMHDVVCGMRLARPVREDEAITWEDLGAEPCDG